VSNFQVIISIYYVQVKNSPVLRRQLFYHYDQFFVQDHLISLLIIVGNIPDMVGDAADLGETTGVPAPRVPGFKGAT
jgi:hypothetical protein